MSKKQIAFTLIELLVVIAIIGILSGLIIVTMNGVTNRANIAKGQIFSNSLRNALMMNMVAEWKFDGSGLNDGDNATTVYTQDTWGGVNNCSIVGTPKVKTGSNCVNGSCLLFNGSTDYLNCGSGSSLNWGSGNLTITLWVGSITEISGWSWFVSKNSGSPGLEIAITNGVMRVSFGTWFTDVVTSPGNWVISLSPWHYITITRRSGVVYSYIDGISYGTPVANNYDFSVITGSPLLLGTGQPGGDRMSGKIDDVRIYNAAMPTSQIKEQYYAGLNSLLISGQISGKEYSERINSIAKQ